LVDSSAQTPKKGVASCDKPRVGACSLRSEDPSIGLPGAVTRRSEMSGNPLN